MVLLDEAIEWMRDQAIDGINKGVLGTSGNLAMNSDTGLVSPDATTEIDVETTQSGNQITLNFSKLSNIGSGTTYREYGVRDSVNSVDWTRFVFTPLESTDYEDWNVKIRLFFRRV